MLELRHGAAKAGRGPLIWSKIGQVRGCGALESDVVDAFGGSRRALGFHGWRECTIYPRM